MYGMMIECPTCGVSNRETVWNENTRIIVTGLNNDDSFTPYIQREEGTAYRCPDINCEDEVITDKNKKIRTQDCEGNPIVSLL